uniref:Uncharacterized protein n=1 Tax=Arundo donax TaxID=35708 RepID=A0A0A9DD30_ARUDO
MAIRLQVPLSGSPRPKVAFQQCCSPVAHLQMPLSFENLKIQTHVATQKRDIQPQQHQ